MQPGKNWVGDTMQLYAPLAYTHTHTNAPPTVYTEFVQGYRPQCKTCHFEFENNTNWLIVSKRNALLKKQYPVFVHRSRCIPTERLSLVPGC